VGVKKKSSNPSTLRNVQGDVHREMLTGVSFAVEFLESVDFQTVPPDTSVMRFLGCCADGNKWRLSWLAGAATSRFEKPDVDKPEVPAARELAAPGRAVCPLPLPARLGSAPGRGSPSGRPFRSLCSPAKCQRGLTGAML